MENKQTKKKYWFKRKRYGFGWTPVTKEGWLAVASHIGFILVGGFLLEMYPSAEAQTLFFIFVMLATGVLITTTVLTGPQGKWRWGRTPQDDPEEDI